MNYTKNHHLPQWVKSDQVKMDDFNAAMANIENGLDTADTALTRATAAQSTASSANTKATAAQSAATAAQTAAAAAQTKADAAYAPGNLPYTVGSYTGDGTNRHIALPFGPSLVIVSGMTESTDLNSTENIRYFGATAKNANMRRRLQVTADGFIVYPDNNYGYYSPSLNEPGRLYNYIAFR